MKQQTLAVAAGFERFGKQSRRAELLAAMEVVVPWRELVALIEPHYPNTGKGRPPIGAERMLRVYFLQQWFNLSDPAVEDALYWNARHFWYQLRSDKTGTRGAFDGAREEAYSGANREPAAAG